MVDFEIESDRRSCCATFSVIYLVGIVLSIVSNANKGNTGTTKCYNTGTKKSDTSPASGHIIIRRCKSNCESCAEHRKTSSEESPTDITQFLAVGVLLESNGASLENASVFFFVNFSPQIIVLRHANSGYCLLGCSFLCEAHKCTDECSKKNK